MATLHEMITIAGSLPKAEIIAEGLGPDYALDLQLCLAAQGKWGKAAKINASRPKNTPREIFASGLFSVIDGDLPWGIYEMHRGRGENLFGSSRIYPGELLTPEIDVNGKTVLFCGEGGFGDEIINIRFAKTLADRGATVITLCRPELVSVFTRVEGVAHATSHGNEMLVEYDYWLPAMSSPGILGISHSDLGDGIFLTPTPHHMAKWRAIIGSRKSFKIGLKWTGNPQFEHEQYRKFPPEMLFSTVAPYGDLFGMDIGQTTPPKVKDVSKLLKSWEDTLAALSLMDAVVTSCTSIAHAAAALGVKTHVIVPVMPYYTWAYPIDSNHTPWYSTVTLHRQEEFGDWRAPFKSLEKALAKA